MRIIKIIEWDMGHRVTNHKSKCRNLHGHRYKAEISIDGERIKKINSSDEGMVIDFGDLKKIAEKYIEDKLDHGFMIWDKDMILVNFFSKNKDQKSIIVPFVPTAENIAYWVFNNLDKRLQDKYNTGLKLHSIKVWETPTSSAICTRGDI